MGQHFFGPVIIGRKFIPGRCHVPQTAFVVCYKTYNVFSGRTGVTGRTGLTGVTGVNGATGPPGQRRKRRQAGCPGK